MEKEKLINALSYLQELERRAKRPVYDFEDHRALSYCDHQLEILPGVEINPAQDGADHLLLRIRRQKEQQPPIPEGLLALWLTLPNDPATQPSLRDDITVKTSELPQDLVESLPSEAFSEDKSFADLNRSDYPDIEVEFNRYLAGPWNEWADAEAPKRRTIAVYGEFFALHNQIELEGVETPTEVVWGTGLSLWKKNGRRVRYPVLTKQLEIALNKESLAVEIFAKESPYRAELDLYTHLEVECSEVQRGIQKLFEGMEQHDEEVDPFQPSSYREILRYALRIDAQAEYIPSPAESGGDDYELPAAGDNLVIADRWVIFARARSKNAILEDVERLKRVIEEADEIPGAGRHIVGDEVDVEEPAIPVAYQGIGGGFRLGEADQYEDKFLYFPLPFNREQVEIAYRLEHRDGVPVQGPPGTGKSHTIANLISHYLAHGKRVLVTSKGEPALEVVRDKLPEAIKPLAVSLLTQERSGIKQLEDSVNEIEKQISQMDVKRRKQDITAGQRHVDHLSQRIASIDNDLKAIATKHLQRVPFLDGNMLPADLAREVVSNRERHGWLKDDLSEQRCWTPTFDESDIDALRGARVRLGEDVQYVGKSVPPLSALPTEAAIMGLHHNLAHLSDLQGRLGTDIPPIQPHVENVDELARELSSQAQELIDRSVALSEPWLDDLRTRYFRCAGSSAEDPVVSGMAKLMVDVGWLLDTSERFIGEDVSLPLEALSDPEVEKAIGRACEGKKPFWFVSGSKHAKERVAEIRVNWEAPASPASWQLVKLYIEMHRAAWRLAAKWNSFAGELKVPKVEPGKLETVMRLIELAKLASSAKKVGETLDREFPERVRQVFGGAVETRNVTRAPEELRRIIDAVNANLEQNELRVHLDMQRTLKRQSLDCEGPVGERYRAFVASTLGKADEDEARLAWHDITDGVERIERLAAELKTVVVVTEKIAASGAVMWAKALKAEPIEIDGRDKWLPSDWRDAWDWACSASYLKVIDQRERLQSLSTERLSLEAELFKANENLVADTAWVELHTAVKGSSRILSALSAYKTAIRKLGKGTGANAPRYRREARREMREAYKAIPCWIMAHHKVSEMFPAELASFDLVIVDEASQSDAWALPSILRAKKLLVVGDDKQVSPVNIGLKSAEEESLYREFLSDIRFGRQLLPGRSLYDLSSTLFAVNRVVLTEHFRCVEPIIEFSNQLCYRTIKPLRIPEPSKRLDPPLIDVFVNGGYQRERQKINEPEARAIVEEIVQTVRDPLYKNRTIGVISLLGSDQAHFIDHLLRAALDPEEIVAHEIHCGDAMTFQGREADIIFLSMVAAGDRLQAQTRTEIEQRFNVAASRAKDRMYLFRSVTPESIPNPSCLRRRLMQHFSNPLAHRPNQAGRDLRELCQSGLESEMFDELVARGYRVIPQVPAGGYFIDLVVEGRGDKRLAIEMDGDAYHTLENWIDDLARQRVLERMGWRFWRCWGSSWNAERGACMDELVEVLTEQGISPQSVDTNVEISPLVERRVIESTDFSEESEAGSLTGLAEDNPQGEIFPN